MAGSDKMEKVDMTKQFGQLKDSDKHFIRKLEQMNAERAKEIKMLRRRNLLTGFCLAGGVLGIYLYSMYAVKQEKFLDDFDHVPDQQSQTNR